MSDMRGAAKGTAAPKHAGTTPMRPATGSASAAHSKKPETPKTPSKAPLVLAGIACALLAAWGIGTLVFGGRFTPNTKVNGIDASGKTADEVAALIDARTAAWGADVTGDGASFRVDAKGAGLSVDSAALAREAMGRVDAKAWPIALVTGSEIRVDEAVSIDRQTLSAMVEGEVAAINQNAKAPVNATYAYDGGSGSFKVVAEVPGSAIDVAAATERIHKAAQTFETTVTLGTDELAKPQVTSASPELKSAVDKANAALQLQIPLTKEGAEVGRVGKDQISSWARVGADLALTLDRESVIAWSEGSLASLVAKSDEENDYEIDSEAMADALTARVSAGDGSAIELPLTVVASRPPESDGARTRGRHVDVNLGTQYARFYDADGSVIWRAPIVSGKTSDGHGTPTGTYSLSGKKTNEVLVGLDEDGDGEPDYRTNVTYWMPFNGGIGLHDADWRGSFGGSIYYYYGSHGCVNLPPAEAAQLFSLINVGDTVYVHW